MNYESTFKYATRLELSKGIIGTLRVFLINVLETNK